MNKQAYERMVGLALDKQAMEKEAFIGRLLGYAAKGGLKALSSSGKLMSRGGKLLAQKGVNIYQGAPMGSAKGLGLVRWGDRISGWGDGLRRAVAGVQRNKGLKNMIGDLTGKSGLAKARKAGIMTAGEAADVERYGNGLAKAKWFTQKAAPYAAFGAGYMMNGSDNA